MKILDAAERDLEDGYRFYERQSEGLGSYFLDSLYSDIDSLAYLGGIAPCGCLTCRRVERSP